MSDDAIPAATVILVRERDGDAPELLMVVRAVDMAFAGGAWVFPGGRIDEADRRIDGSDGGARVAAVREALEETAIPIGLSPLPSPELSAELQAQLLDGSINELENWEDRIRNSGKVLGSGSPLGLVRTLNNFANIYWFYAQIYRAGRGEAFADKLNPMLALLEVMRTERKIFGERKRMGRAQARAA